MPISPRDRTMTMPSHDMRLALGADDVRTPAAGIAIVARCAALVRMLALIACVRLSWSDVMPDPVQTSAMGAFADGAPDPNGGGDAPLTASGVASDLQSYAQSVQTAVGTADGQDMDALYDNMLWANAQEVARLASAEAGAGMPSGSQPAMQSGALAFTMGGESAAPEFPSDLAAPPGSAQFVLSGKNQLSNLDATMKRSSQWLNRHTCGGFDWATQFSFMFKAEVLREYVTQLGEGVVAAAPMALLGAFSPQLAEIVKHLKLVAGLNLGASKMDCQAIQGALTQGLQKTMWGDAYSACLEDNKNAGIDAAVQICQNATQAAVPDANGLFHQPLTSQAMASAGGWLSNATSPSEDWFSSIWDSSSDHGAAAAQVASQVASNGGSTGNSQAAAAGTAAAAQSSGGGAVASLLAEGEGSALADLGRTLLGSVRIQGTGALEMGRKDFGLFTLQMDAHAAALHDRLEAQLAEHMQLLLDGTPEELGDSYRRLKLWTFACRGGEHGIPPWNDPMYAAPVDDPRSMAAKSRRITDRTMDACAYLLASANRYKANTDMLSGQYASYGIESFVDALAHYELYLYVYRSMTKAVQQLTALLHGSPQTGSSEAAIATAAQSQFDSAMAQLRLQVGVEQNRVLAYLTAIDDFVPPSSPRRATPSPGSAPALPGPAISFPMR